MKIKSLVLVGLLSLTSCANSSEPFFVQKFFPLDTEEGPCGLGLRDTTVSSGGYLDVAAGAPQFFVGFIIAGAEKVTQNELAVGANTLELADRNRPIVTQQSVTYKLSKRVGATPKPYLTNRTIRFNDDSGEIIGPIQLISPELGTALFDGLTPSNALDDFVDITAEVSFTGEFSASKHPFSTGVLTYPIRAFRSSPAAMCANGFVKFPTDVGTGLVNGCRHVGQEYEQLVPPTPPSICCTQAGPGGGAGC
jgi:hypothetical protein